MYQHRLFVAEHQRILADIQKVEAMEVKVKDELSTLRQKMETYSDELNVFGNIDKLRADVDDKKKVSEGRIQ